jgi:GTP-binding protein HflX
MDVVEEVLTRLGAGSKPILTVYNKCDIADGFIPEKGSVAISAKTLMGIEDLKNAVTQMLAAARKELSVLLPLDSGALVSRVYANGQVTGCDYLEEGIRLTAAVTIEDASRLSASAIKIY